MRESECLGVLRILKSHFRSSNSFQVSDFELLSDKAANPLNLFAYTSLCLRRNV